MLKKSIAGTAGKDWLLTLFLVVCENDVLSMRRLLNNANIILGLVVP